MRGAGVAEGWGAVADAFHANFVDPGEDAAAVTVYHRGRKVVDLVGGRDVLRGRTVADDALMMVASCSKGITATLLALLVQDSLIDVEAPVAHYWPEFATAGKSNVTVAMVASHTAGLPYPPLGSGLSGLDLHRGPAVTALLAGATPMWEPGTAMAYHPVTYGTLLDEIVRRATGVDLATHLRQRIAGPLDVEMWFGAPSSVFDRVVPDRWPPAAPSVEEEAPVGSYAHTRTLHMQEEPPMTLDHTDDAALAAAYGASRPAIGAITDARSLAKMYAATIGEVDGVRLLTDDTRRFVTTPRTDEVETLVESGTTGPDIRFGLGFQLSSPSMPGWGPASFGHTGAGGRLGIADPERELALGYVCSRMSGIGPSGDARWRRLLDAAAAVQEGQ
ncbi:serine hydrolase domain-containing protein [Microbacterium sp. RG1]|uniref:serine hydrolase domain-containing protein n=1 Tax=Microbacterium sp. RG1 TaxID=2489212 RepID=UPI0010CA46E8|nr:serine hydrolase domain-containing protein [Microbacterium sp. RG1]QCQ16606.1 class A beta-lactamase-related serine hydrolase [Microbacterium sp. RG1]